MNDEISLDEIASAMAAACSFSRPDEYQQRHNHLTRMIARYILKDHLPSMEANDE